MTILKLNDNPNSKLCGKYNSKFLFVQYSIWTTFRKSIRSAKVLCSRSNALVPLDNKGTNNKAEKFIKHKQLTPNNFTNLKEDLIQGFLIQGLKCIYMRK